MNKLVILLVFILSIICIDNIVLSQVADNSTVVSLIVDINGNNEYPLNGYCGNQTFACNTIVDAVNYFSTIKNVQSTTTYSSYQQLELLLADGKYNFSSICFNMYQFNLTISPLTVGSDGVFVDGWTGNVIDPCFMVTPPVPGTPDSNSIGSFSLFTNINFNNFQQPIFQVKTNSSFTNIQFESCTFFQFNTPNISMIDINSEFTTNLTNPNSNLVFNNTNFKNVYSTESPLIITVNTNINLYSVGLDGGNFEEFINSTYGGIVNIQGSGFTSVLSSYGIISSLNTDISIVGSTFTSNSATGASVLTFNSNVLNEFTFNIIDSNFNGNTAQTDGGVIIAKNSGFGTNSIAGGTIVNSGFNGNKASWGGVIFSSNFPLSITNSTFIGNSAKSIGGVIFIEFGILGLVNTTFTQSSPQSSFKVSTLDSTQLEGQVIYASYATVSINASTFDSEFSETIYCLSSIVTIDSATVFDPSSLTCTNTCTFNLNSKQICQSVTGSSENSGVSTITTSSSSSSTSGTTTGTGNSGSTSGTGSTTSSIGTTRNSVITISSSSSTSSTTTTDGSVSSKLNIQSPIILFSFIFCLIFIL